MFTAAVVRDGQNARSARSALRCRNALTQHCRARCGWGGHAGAKAPKEAVDAGAKRSCANDDGDRNQRRDKTVFDGRCAIFLAQKGLNPLNECHGGYLFDSK